MVGSLVLPQILVDLEGLLTILNVTGEASLFVVDHFVDPQSSTSTECLFTNVTVVRFLSCVNTFVILQGSLDCECFSTSFTFKRLLMSVVPPYVNIEVELLLKHLVTTVVRALTVVSQILEEEKHELKHCKQLYLRIHMAHPVLLQFGGRLELLGAILAEEGEFTWKRCRHELGVTQVKSYQCGR